MARMKERLLKLQEAQEQRAKRNAEKKHKLLGIQPSRQLQTVLKVPASLQIDFESYHKAAFNNIMDARQTAVDARRRMYGDRAVVGPEWNLIVSDCGDVISSEIVSGAEVGQFLKGKL